MSEGTPSLLRSLGRQCRTQATNLALVTVERIGIGRYRSLYDVEWRTLFEAMRHVIPLLEDIQTTFTPDRRLSLEFRERRRRLGDPLLGDLAALPTSLLRQDRGQGDQPLRQRDPEGVRGLAPPELLRRSHCHSIAQT